MKVLLVQPPSGSEFGFTNILRIEPLGLECVGGALEEGGHEVEIADLRVDTWDGLKARYERFGPDAVGVSSQFITDVYPAHHVAGYIRALDPNVTLFAGGHHASLRTTDFVFEDSVFDALVVGEGEQTSADLIDAVRDGRSLDEVAGVMTPANQHNGFKARPATRSLDELPLPARHLTAEYRKKYHHGSWVPSAALETSRGCPFDCNFCSVWVFYARRARRRSAEGVMRDLETIPEDNVFFTDDIAFIHRPSYEELGNRIKAAGMFRNYSAETRCDLVVKYEDMFDLWKSVGLRTIFLGVEKIDDAGLESVRKRTDQEKNALAIRILQDKGIRPMPSFIIDPQWTEDDFDRLEAYVDLMKLDQPGFTILTPLPGTELYDHFEDRLVTDNYLMFDVTHSVLPTRLPLERFYERFAGLYKLTGKHQGGLSWGAFKSLMELTFGGYGWVFWRLVKALRQMRDPKAYLEVPVPTGAPGIVPLAPMAPNAPHLQEAEGVAVGSA